MAGCDKTSGIIKVIQGVCVGLSILVLGWLCSATKENETSIAVHGEQIVNIYKTQEELKEDNKEMLRLLNEIRSDQLRRAGIAQ